MDEKIEEMVERSRQPLSAKDRHVSLEFINRLNDSYRRCSNVVSTLAEKDVLFKRNVIEQSQRIRDLVHKRKLRSLI